MRENGRGQPGDARHEMTFDAREAVLARFLANGIHVDTRQFLFGMTCLFSGNEFSDLRIVAPREKGAPGRRCQQRHHAGCNTAEADDLDALIQRIAASGVTVVLVEHNMKLVMKISSRIHVLDQGRTLTEGKAADVRANEAVIAAYLGTAEAQHAQN